MAMDLQGKACLLISFLLFSLVLPPALAAELNLILVNKVTGEPVEDATVVVENGNGQHAMSDHRGRLSFRNLGYPVRMKILAAGYAPVRFSLHPRKPTVKVLLTPLAVEAAELEVVADRIPEKISKITLSHEEVAHAPGGQGDALKVIQSLPGVVTVNGNSGMMYIRGSNPDENGVWINTLPVGYLYHWGGLRSTLNPALIEDFNLFLGGFPVEYMDRLGGMLDIRLRAPRKDRFHQHYHLGTFESSFLIEGPIGKTDGKDGFYVAARRSYIDLLASPDTFNSALGNEGEKDDQIVTVPRFYDVQVLWQRELPEGSFQLQYFSAGDELKLDNRATAKSDPELVGELSQTTSYQTAGITWQRQWREGWNSQVAFSLEEQRDDISLGTDLESGNPFFAESVVQTLRLQPEFIWERDEKSSLSGGAELTYVRAPIDLHIATPPAADEPFYDFTGAEKYRKQATLHARGHALFVKHRTVWNKKFSTTVGLRYSRITGTAGISMSGVAPRVAAEYQLDEHTLLTAAWGHYFQVPSGEKLIEGFGNPDLDFTRAEHRILGIQHRLSPSWHLQLEAYHKPLKNLVIRVPDAGPGKNYLNRGEGETYGIDLFIKREAGGGKSGWLSYSWGRSLRFNQLTGERYPSTGDQPHTLTLVWQQPFPKAVRWAWGIKLQAATGKPYTPVIGRYQETLPNGNKRWRPIHGKVNSERLPDYFSLDVRFDYRVPVKGWKLGMYVELQNITRHENVIRYDFGNIYQYHRRPKKVTGLPFIPFFGITATF